MKQFSLSSLDIDNLSSCGYIEVTPNIISFVELCKNLEMGYEMEYDKVLPFLYRRNLRFVTSLEKELKSLGHNLSSSTNLLLTSVAILFKNTKHVNLTLEECKQIEYPYKNNCSIETEMILNQIKYFPNLVRVILVGEINLAEIDKYIEYNSSKGIMTTIRMFYNYVCGATIMELLEKHPSLSIELIVDKSDKNNNFFRMPLSHPRLYFIALIYETTDVDFFSDVNNVIFLPIICDSIKQSSLIQQLILKEEEILNIRRTVDQWNQNEYINSNIYGHIAINSEGKVYCIGEEIGSINDTDLSNIVNHWVGGEHCQWYYPRKKKETCINCALACICPTISIYEELGLYSCPCKI